MDQRRQTNALTRDVHIREAATRFRRAIEACPPAALGAPFEDFPHGACGDATPLLGTYLAEQRFGEFQYVPGERREACDEGAPCYHSHAWLEQDGLLVDITADQFAGVTEPVIVTREPSALHACFDRNVEHKADYRIYDAQTVATLAVMYAQILAAMPDGSALP